MLRKRVELLACVVMLGLPLWAQAPANSSSAAARSAAASGASAPDRDLAPPGAEVDLAPLRAEAKRAFAAEVDRAAKGDCQDSRDTANHFTDDRCYAEAASRSQADLKSYRAAIRELIEARASLFDARMLGEFEASERAWDVYCERQAQVTEDMVDNQADKSGSAAATRIDLIRGHMRDLDKLYYILLHDDCGACLVNR